MMLRREGSYGTAGQVVEPNSISNYYYANLCQMPMLDTEEERVRVRVPVPSAESGERVLSAEC